MVSKMVNEKLCFIIKMVVVGYGDRIYEMAITGYVRGNPILISHGMVI